MEESVEIHLLWERSSRVIVGDNMELLLGITAFILLCMYIGKKSDCEHWESKCKLLETNEQLLRNAQNEANNIKNKANVFYQSKITAGKNEADTIKNEANAFYQSQVAAGNDYYNSKKRTADYLEKAIKTRVAEFPVLATILGDVLTAKDKWIADKLETKKNPALKAADELRKIRLDKRKLIAENKAYQWELQYLRELIPWIEELEDDVMQPKTFYTNDYNGDDKNDKDDAKLWLTSEEYKNLPTTQKYQLALDRYNRRNKSNAEIGLEYERYVGYRLEKDGWSVEYHGANKGKEDMGRDLICVRDNLIYIVQCKCWSQRKEIHEKHINQLFGSAMVYYLSDYPRLRTMQLLGWKDEDCDALPYMEDDNPQKQAWNATYDNVIENTLFANDQPDIFHAKRIMPVFISTAPYSDKAIKFAHELGVTIIIEPLGTYPVIKCNINKNGEKIYHLPFDQQYDNCVIKNTGECYVSTVAEAEALGFRRAKRWRGNNVD